MHTALLSMEVTACMCTRMARGGASPPSPCPTTGKNVYAITSIALRTCRRVRVWVRVGGRVAHLPCEGGRVCKGVRAAYVHWRG